MPHDTPGVRCHRVRSVTRAYGLHLVWERKFVHTTDSKHTLPASPNVLARQFDKALRNQAWVCDITYVRTRSGWLYLAAELDLLGLTNSYSFSATPLPVWWCIRTGERSTPVHSIKGC